MCVLVYVKVSFSSKSIRVSESVGVYESAIICECAVSKTPIGEAVQLCMYFRAYDPVSMNVTVYIYVDMGVCLNTDLQMSAFVNVPEYVFRSKWIYTFVYKFMYIYERKAVSNSVRMFCVGA